MLLRLFKSNSPVMHLFTVAVAVLLWLPVISNTDWQPAITDGTILFHNLRQMLLPNYWTAQMIAFLLMLIEAFMLQRIDLKFIIVEDKVITPPLFFILIISMLAQSYNILPVMLANLLFMLTIMRTFDSEHLPEQKRYYFESGLLLGIGALLYPPLTAMLLFVIATQFVVRFFDIREFLALVLGFVLPFGFYLFGMFMTDQQGLFWDRMEQFFETQDFTLNLGIVQIAAICYMALIVLIELVVMSQYIRMYKVTTRKYFMLFFWLIIISVAGFFLIPCAGLTMLVFVAIALAFITSLYFMQIRRNAVGEILFLLLIISSFLMVYLF